jgi:Holliday junction DNA helicase RuvB
LNVDAFGLDEMDNKISKYNIDKFKGGPVGLSTLPLRSQKVVRPLRKSMSLSYSRGFYYANPRGREVT